MANRHNHARFKVAGPWILWRSLHLGCRGWAGSEYILENTETGRNHTRDSLRDVNLFLEQAGYGAVDWRPHADWYEIQGKPVPRSGGQKAR